MLLEMNIFMFGIYGAILSAIYQIIFLRSIDFRRILNTLIAWICVIPFGLFLDKSIHNTIVSMGISSTLICLIRNYNIFTSVFLGSIFGGMFYFDIPSLMYQVSQFLEFYSHEYGIAMYAYKVYSFLILLPDFMTLYFTYNLSWN